MHCENFDLWSALYGVGPGQCLLGPTNRCNVIPTASAARLKQGMYAANFDIVLDEMKGLIAKYPDGNEGWIKHDRLAQETNEVVCFVKRPANNQQYFLNELFQTMDGIYAVIGSIFLLS